MPVISKIVFFLTLLGLIGCGSGLCPLGTMGTQACRAGSSIFLGVLDTSFNGTGYLQLTIGAYAEASDIALQPDGKILVTGRTDNGVNNDYFVLRFLSNGTLDPSFNGTGIVTTDISADHDYGTSIKIQDDGKILVCGMSTPGAWRHSIARYNSNGTIDTSFNGTGFRTTNLTAQDWGSSLVIQPDGKIVFTGEVETSIFNHNVGIVRYNADGSLDTSFNGTGMRISQPTAGDDNPNRMILTSDGSYLMTGYTTNATQDMAVFKYLSTGVLDTSFNGTGFNSVAIGDEYEWTGAGVVDSSQRILLGGSGYYNPSSYFVAFTRFLSTGVLDTSFGTNGTLSMTLVPGDWHQMSSCAMQSDEKFVCAGRVGSQVLVMRLR